MVILITLYNFNIGCLTPAGPTSKLHNSLQSPVVYVNDGIHSVMKLY